MQSLLAGIPLVNFQFTQFEESMSDITNDTLPQDLDFQTGEVELSCWCGALRILLMLDCPNCEKSYGDFRRIYKCGSCKARYNPYGLATSALAAPRGTSVKTVG